MIRRGVCCLMLLTLLYSGGCAAKTELAPVYPAHCARPPKPELPKLSSLKFLESREAYSLLKLRDSIMRTYIAGLEDALDCYEAQTGDKEWTPSQ